MKKFFKKNLLKFARKIIRNFDPETEKRLSDLEKFEVRVLDRSIDYTEAEWLDSIFEQRVAEKIQYKNIQKMVNAVFCKGLIQTAIEVDAHSKIHRCHLRLRVLFPKQ